jgi:hypothetical protein
MVISFQCLWYLCIHKYYVYKFGILLNVPIWRLLFHDCSKLLPIELYGYIDYFNKKQTRTPAYYLALHHHLRTNRHHWNYYVLPLENKYNIGDTNYYILPMPNEDIREMVADWAAAGYAKHRYYDLDTYYTEREDQILLHSDTRQTVEYYIEKLRNEEYVKHLRLRGKVQAET